MSHNISTILQIETCIDVGMLLFENLITEHHRSTTTAPPWRSPSNGTRFETFQNFFNSIIICVISLLISINTTLVMMWLIIQYPEVWSWSGSGFFRQDLRWRSSEWSHRKLLSPSLCWNGARWSRQRANDRQKGHIDGQSTNGAKTGDMPKR